MCGRRTSKMGYEVTSRMPGGRTSKMSSDSILLFPIDKEQLNIKNKKKETIILHYLQFDHYYLETVAFVKGQIFYRPSHIVRRR